MEEDRADREQETEPGGEEPVPTRAEWEQAVRERDEARRELEQVRRERFLLERGVSAEDVDYYAYRIGRLTAEGQDFRQAAEQFLRERPPRGPAAVRLDTGARLGGGDRVPSASETMNQLIRGARK